MVREEEHCPNCGAVEGEYEMTCMGGDPDPNRRTCLRCECTWFGYEKTADMVRRYISGITHNGEEGNSE